jgi:hypothetical protein
MAPGIGSPPGWDFKRQNPSLDPSAASENQVLKMFKMILVESLSFILNRPKSVKRALGAKTRI